MMVKETQAAMPAYDTDTPWPGNRFIHVDGIAQGSKIDWADMLPTYSQGTYTDAQAEAVAKLMQYCGVSVYMDYASGTGAGNAKGGYNQLMRAVIGVKPATAGSPQNKESNIIVQNFKVDEGQLSANFVNGLDVEQKAELGFAYRKADGELQLVAATVSTKMAPPRKLYYSPYTLKCPVTSLSDGTYKVVPVARTQPENKWQSVWSAENMPRRPSKADGWSAIPSSRRRPSNCRSWLPATSP